MPPYLWISQALLAIIHTLLSLTKLRNNSRSPHSLKLMISNQNYECMCIESVVEGSY